MKPKFNQSIKAYSNPKGISSYQKVKSLFSLVLFKLMR